MRDGLRMLLDREPGMQVVGDAADGRAAIDLARTLLPDVIVMDITLPGLNGIEATRQVRSNAPNAKVIALSMHSDKRYVMEMLKAGAAAYLLKNSASDELVRAIHAVLADQRFLSPGIANVVVDHLVQNPTSTGTAFTDLTPREREVLQMIAEGKTSKEIARELSSSAKTVETQRRDIMQKLDLHSVAELTRYAIREGLVGLDG